MFIERVFVAFAIGMADKVREGDGMAERQRDILREFDASLGQLLGEELQRSSEVRREGR